MYLVLLETSGNQNFIFSTNKLRENIGASQLTYLSGTQWVLDAVEEVTKVRWTKDNRQLRDKLLDSNLNQPIGDDNNVKVEIIIATSGKALLITKDELTAKSIVQYVTLKSLDKAPGLDICGAIKSFEWNHKNSLAETIDKIYRTHQIVHARHPSPDLRFLRLPIIDECQISGLPAAQIDTINGKTILRSQISYKKHKHIDDGFKRIEKLLKLKKSDINFARSVRAMDEEWRRENPQDKTEPLDWLAVVHADGNGLGKIFSNFKISDNREYVDKLRKFSIALDICTENAFLSAIDVFETKNIKNKAEEDKIIPVVPIILGGDDLTVICDGRSALDFTVKFLQAFEKESEKLDHPKVGKIIPEIAQKAFNIGRLSACAGIAIIKPHYPFSIAYELAENLIRKAKITKTIVTKNEQFYPCSALDFHILDDSSGIDLEEIRERLTVDEGKTKLHQKPYVITEIEKLQAATGQDWIELHHWNEFKKRVAILLSKDKNNQARLNIPSSQVEYLRYIASIGREAINNQYKLIRQRYPAFEELVEDKVTNSLFAKEPETDDNYVTGLFDALEAIKFLKIEENTHEVQP